MVRAPQKHPGAVCEVVQECQPCEARIKFALSVVAVLFLWKAHAVQPKHLHNVCAQYPQLRGAPCVSKNLSAPPAASWR